MLQPKLLVCYVGILFVSFVANLFHEFVGDLGSFVRPGGMRGAITINMRERGKGLLMPQLLLLPLNR